jgi:hypothetical protein
MDTKELVELRKELFSQIEIIMDLKGKEYSGKIDRLANFKRNGNNLGLPPESIWAVYCGKHWDSLMSFIREIGEGKDIEEIEKNLSEPINGRILDIITYLILLQGLIQERRFSCQP